jgi:hypothetical protein
MAKNKTPKDKALSKSVSPVSVKAQPKKGDTGKPKQEADFIDDEEENTDQEGFDRTVD